MADGKSIFGDNKYEWKGSVKDSCIGFSLINNGKEMFDGLVAQQIQFGITRQPRLVFEIGSSNYYAVDSRPSGSGSLTNVFGPSSAALNAIQTLGDICNPTQFKIILKNCTCGGREGRQSGTKTLLFDGGFLAGVSITAVAENPTAQGSWSFIFQDLKVS